MHICRNLSVRVSRVLKHHYGTKIAVELEDIVHTDVSKGLLNPKRHPGIINSKSISLPPNITAAIKCALGDTPIKAVVQDSLDLVNYLKSRHPPVEERKVLDKRKEIVSALDEQEKLDFTGKSDEEIERLTFERNRKVDKILKEKLYTWKAISYDKYTALRYLVSRAAPEYAVLHRILNEITNRVRNYKPASFFDFGSGVGTGTWVVQQFWKDSVQEIFTVDSSADMNDLARLILCDGIEGAELPIKRFFQRQFLPATPSEYDIVLCAYSLFELPSAQNRLLTVLNLWRKTRDFLILVEQGTNAGYSLINEARDFILEYKEGPLMGHVLAPCPHDSLCPRFYHDTTPCNFPMKYGKLKLTEKIEHGEETYSYVILRKGQRPPDNQNWPRIVRPALIRSKHVICRMCGEDGKLSEIIFTPRKHGKVMYKCAKSSKWGDRLPIRMSPTEENSTSLDAVIDNDSLNQDKNSVVDETPPVEK